MYIRLWMEVVCGRVGYVTVFARRGLTLTRTLTHTHTRSLTLTLGFSTTRLSHTHNPTIAQSHAYPTLQLLNPVTSIYPLPTYMSTQKTISS